MSTVILPPPEGGFDSGNGRSVERVSGYPPADGFLADQLLAEGDQAMAEALGRQAALALGRGTAERWTREAILSHHVLALAASRAGHAIGSEYADELLDIYYEQALPERQNELATLAIEHAKARIDSVAASSPGDEGTLRRSLENIAEDDLGRFSDADLHEAIPMLVDHAGFYGERGDALVQRLLKVGGMGRRGRDAARRGSRRAALEAFRREKFERLADGLSRYPTYVINTETGRVAADEEREAAEIARAEAEHVEAVTDSGAASIKWARSNGAAIGTIVQEAFTAACFTRGLPLDLEDTVARFVDAAGDAGLAPLVRKTIDAGRSCGGPAETEAAFSTLLATEGIAAPFAFTHDAPVEPAYDLAEEVPAAVSTEALAASALAEVSVPNSSLIKSSTLVGNSEPRSPPNIDPFDFAHEESLVGDVARWILASSYRPIPEFALMGAIAFCATLFGRCYETPTGIGLNLYLIGLAGASFGKEDLIGLPQQLLFETGNQHLMGPGDVTSDSAIETTLRARPCILMPMDEIGVFLQGMNSRNAGGWEKRIRKSLLELYSKSHKMFTGKQRASAERINAEQPIWCPTISILGAAVEEGFYAGMDEQNLKDGMVARLTVIKASGRPSRNSRRGRVVVSQALITAVQNSVKAGYEGSGNRSAANHRDPFVRPEMQQVAWETDAIREQWEEIEERQLDVIEREPGLEGILGRTAAQVLKLASIRAIATDPRNPRISDVDLAWGHALVMRSVDTIQRGVSDHMAGSDFEVLCKTIFRHAREAPNGSIAWSVLMRKKGVSKAEPRVVRAAIERLVEQRFIYNPKIGDGERSEKGGRPGIRITVRPEE